MITNPVKNWELERYLLGELPLKRMDVIKKLLETNAELRGELAALKRSEEDILKQYPPETMVPRIEKQLQTGPEKKAAQRVLRKRLLLATPAFATALVVLFIVLHNPGGHTTRNLQGLQSTRIKGTEKIDKTKPHILIHRKVNNTIELLENGDKARAGDLLQIAYISVDATYGVIFSIDGRGVVTLHYPDGEDKDTILDQNEKILLPASYELDDAPDFERFFFITSKSELDVQSILNRAKEMAKNPAESGPAGLDLPDSSSQYFILIKKGE